MVGIDWDYGVTGALTPDVTGHFAEWGTFGGQNVYKHVDLEWYIWWDNPFNWVISNTIGAAGASWWISPGGAIEAVYAPQGGAVGNATVANGGD